MTPWLLIASMTLAAGETITVTTLEDTTDFGGGQTVADLPGPDGAVSFREALTAANNTAGEQVVHFAIPATEWWLYDDRAMLRQEDGTFVLTDDGTTVDFSTQTDFTGDTNPDGFEVGVYGLQPNGGGSPAISISADGCTVKGLDRVMQRGYGVSISGNGNRVVAAFSDCITAGGDAAMPGDATGDGWVGIDDLVALFEAWGACPDPQSCPADLDDSGVVDVDDLVICILNWS